MPEWNELFKTTVALLAIVNPFGGIPLFIGALSDISDAERSRVARTVAWTVFVVLAVAALAGDWLLKFFGISIASFMVGGGILLLLMAVSMLQARESRVRQTPEEAVEAAERQALGVVPIGVPVLAGPGAISTVIIYAHQDGISIWGGLLLLGPILVVAIAVRITFLLAMPISVRLGTTGLNILTRLMGLLLAAMAVEIIARGLLKLFPALQ